MRRWLPALLLLAVAAGVAGGLFYTWVLDPMAISTSTPDVLRTRDKLVYLALVGDLYGHEDDLARAEGRLAALGVPADGQVLAALIEEHVGAGGRIEDVRNLARLAEALGASGGVLTVFAGPTPEARPSPTAAAAIVPAASPTALPSPTPAPSFRLTEQTALCAAAGQPGLIAVHVQAAGGEDLPGMELLVEWPGGQDRFWTGLRPAQGAGYADFQMAAGSSYQVSLAGYRGDVASDLSPAPPALAGRPGEPGLCPEGVTAVDWRLTFRQMP